MSLRSLSGLVGVGAFEALFGAIEPMVFINREGDRSEKAEVFRARSGAYRESVLDALRESRIELRGKGFVVPAREFCEFVETASVLGNVVLLRHLEFSE